MKNPLAKIDTVWFIWSVVLFSYVVLLWIDYPLRSFSSDSWSYQELAHSFASGDPYRIITLRSYWSLEYSASFPPGYPFIIYLLHRFFDQTPYVAVGLNVMVAVITPLASAWLTRVLTGQKLAGLIAGFALLLYLPYIEEVLAGRSIPLAILLSISGLASLFSIRKPAMPVIAGLLLGLACLVRFDQLPLVLLFFVLALWQRQPFSRLMIAGITMMVTISPWIYMSWEHFGKLWASDNSWVAISSQPAYVTDFPAIAPQTLWTHPADFLSKCLNNVLTLIQGLISAIIRYYPILPIALVFGWLNRKSNQAVPFSKAHYGVLVVATLALTPQIVTGYITYRYFSFILLCALIFLFSTTVTNIKSEKNHRIILLWIGLVLNFTMVALWAKEHAASREISTVNLQQQKQLLMALDQCHAAESNVLYVFPAKGGHVPATRYGAEYRRRAALMPNNINLGNTANRNLFEQTLVPLRYVTFPENSGINHDCDKILSPLTIKITAAPGNM